MTVSRSSLREVKKPAFGHLVQAVLGIQPQPTHFPPCCVLHQQGGDLRLTFLASVIQMVEDDDSNRAERIELYEFPNFPP